MIRASASAGSGVGVGVFLLLPRLLAGAAWLAQEPAPPAESSGEDAKTLATVLVYLLILVVVFMFGSYAIMRASRRFRGALSRRKADPTEAGDVWAMHKVPENLELEDEPDESGGGNGNGE